MSEQVPVKEHMAMAFGTPVIAYPWPDSETLNAELRQVILDKEKDNDGVVKSNVGGWHSATNFFAGEQDCVRTLKMRVQNLVIDLMRAITVAPEGARTFNFRTDGWANVSRDGDYNNVHNHPNCLWSGVYYVAEGKPDPDRPNNGKLELFDPRAGVNMIFIENTMLHGRYTIDPIPGLMVVFPAWLQHMVHPFFGKGERISVSFNVLIGEDRRPAQPAGQDKD